MTIDIDPTKVRMPARTTAQRCGREGHSDHAECFRVEEVKLLPATRTGRWLMLPGDRLVKVQRRRFPGDGDWAEGSVAIVNSEQQVQEGMRRVGGGRPESRVEFFTEVVPSTQDAYDKALRVDRVKAARRAAQERPRLANVLSLHPYLYQARGAADIVATYRSDGFEPVKVGGRWELLETGSMRLTTGHVGPWRDAQPVVGPYLDSGERQAPTCEAQHREKTALEAVAVGVLGSLLCAGHADGTVPL